MNARAAPDDAVLLQLLRSPAAARELSPRDWEDVFWQARSTRLGGRLWHHLRDENLPPVVQRRLLAAFTEAEYQRRQMLWEIDRLRRVIAAAAPDFILLKGGAYAAIGLEIALGRPVGDLDVMVPFEKIAEIERAVLANGWEHVIIDEYDQRYYRAWMHELPPLCHRDRETELDLHHAIAPRTSRLRLDMGPMFKAAVPIEPAGPRTLAPIDMVLHCVVHLFHDGEIAGSLRDLVDFDGLLRHFAGNEFWSNLVPRALALGLGRPLFYGLRYAKRLSATPIPEAVIRACEAVRPSPFALALMDFAVPRALVPASSPWARAGARISAFGLYMRSHWLRMSMLPLLAHLARKSVRRWKPRPSEA